MKIWNNLVHELGSSQFGGQEFGYGGQKAYFWWTGNKLLVCRNLAL
jgi:hypothetical protein